ncbi:hypothetical protein ACTHPF_04925 [Paenibacillus sp. SAF-054]|uniref:hypothetical protein n=1 Tax=unclassified Paenibacillus TaxID=185978 RepID=UPI003F80A389
MKQDKNSFQPQRNQTAKPNDVKDSKEKDTELAEELGSSDVRSAFKNPITGEERLY